jgi:uncharacterized membrane protein
MNQDMPNDLSGVPTPKPTPAPSSLPPPSSGPSSQATSSFDFNQPTIISALYLSGFVLGVTWIVGVVLAYVWKGEAKSEWEASHYTYLIRTFWIGFIGTVISIFLMIVLIGFLLWAAVAVLMVVRCVLSLINAQKHEPMPNPETWLA